MPVWEDYEERNRFNPFSPTRTGELARMAKKNPWDALNVAERNGNGYQPDPWVEFCIPPNPLWTSAMATAYSDAVTNILANGADPKTELDAAQAKVEAELAALA